MTYVARSIEPYLRDKLGRGRAIVIYGPRRSGKTTLAKRLLETYNKGDIAEYQTDDPKQAALFTADGEALRRLVAGKKAVFIDEAQAIENAGLVMKLLVDMFPEVQVIATGSSSFELSDKLKESMVGRVHTVTLLPLSVEELAVNERGRLLFDAERSLTYGGYPEVILHHDIEATERLQAIVGSYLYKDILTLTDTRNPEVLGRMLTALALQVGQEVSYNELAGMLEVSRTTVERYLYLLEQCYVVFRLHPLSSNPRKLLASRKRKVYFYDLGVRAAFAGQLGMRVTETSQLGGVFENFCVLERLKARLNHQMYGPTYYWRSPDSEIDYVEQYAGQTYAYEIKWNKVKRKPPARFSAQFPDAGFVSIHKDNFWRLIEAGRGE